jgi:alpha-1,4-N-acetylglucosaminyltransferase EXTL3
MSLARVTEMHFLIRSFPDTDLFYMRRQGRLIWQNYLGSTHTILSSMIGLVRQRIGLPPAPMVDKASSAIFNDTYRFAIQIV